MANTAANFEAKVQAYYKTTLGRDATSSELASWSQTLANNNGNVWKSGFVAALNGDELSVATAGKTSAEIVDMMYKNLVGSTIPSSLSTYYAAKLDSGEIKVRGLANSLLNDLALMPKADGSFGQPANWGANLSSNVSTEDSVAAQARIKFTLLAASTFTTGNDTITGTDGTDFLDGAAGNDSINGGAGADKLLGGAGRDTLIGGRGLDYIDGGDGDDRIEATIYYNSSSQWVSGYWNNLGSWVPGYYTYTYDYDAYNETLLGGAGVDTIYGSYGSDSIDGGSGADVIYADGDYYIYSASDVVARKADAGADTIYGGDGADTIYAGYGNNWVDAGTAGDSVYGAIGNDTVYAGEGNDYVYSYQGNDSVFGGTGNDSIYGGDGNDYIEGEIGADSLDGGQGDDTILGGAGDDRIYSDSGSDSIVAGEGADIIYIELGNDASDKVDLTDTDGAVDKVVFSGVSDYRPTQYDPVLINGFDVNYDQLDLNLYVDLFTSTSSISAAAAFSYNSVTRQYDIVSRDYLQQVSSPSMPWLSVASTKTTKDDYGKAFFAITGASAADNQLTTIASYLDPYGNNATYGNAEDHIFIFNIANINGTGVSGAAIYQFHDDTNADNVILGDELFPLAILVGVDASAVKATNFVS